jgi:hypothetical protein
VFALRLLLFLDVAVDEGEGERVVDGLHLAAGHLQQRNGQRINARELEVLLIEAQVALPHVLDGVGPERNHPAVLLGDAAVGQHEHFRLVVLGGVEDAHAVVGDVERVVVAVDHVGSELREVEVVHPEHFLPQQLSVAVDVDCDRVVPAALRRTPHCERLRLGVKLQQGSLGEQGRVGVEVVGDEGGSLVGGGAVGHHYLEGLVVLVVDGVEGSLDLAVVGVVVDAEDEADVLLGQIVNQVLFGEVLEVLRVLLGEGGVELGVL